MTVEIDGVDLAAAAEAAALIGGIVAMLVIGLLVYLLVRPPRHVREAGRPVELQESEAEQLLDLMGRMESRLEVLERALADESRSAGPAEDKQILESAGCGRETRRIK